MSAIKAGDLVMVVKPKGCGCADTLGLVFVVAEIVQRERPPVCFNCGACSAGTNEFYALKRGDGIAQLHRLKKIDPPSDTITRDREIENV